MKRIISLITALLSIINSTLLPAQQSSTFNNNSLLWRISGNHLSKPSYIFGTMHLICPDDYVWTEHMKKSLSESDKICLEMDMDDPSVLMQVAKGLIDTSGKKLEDYFTPQQYNLVKRYVKDSLGMDIAFFQQMKPIALQSIMTSNGITCSNPISYEDSIMKTAQKSKKEILGLEEPKEQLAVLESIPVDTLIKDLLEEIQGTNNNDSDYQQLITAYKAQDIRALYLLITSSKDLGDMGIFLDQRNKKWIPRMAGKMKNSSVFFAVGAGHLWGDKGIITLLRKEGYTVEPER